MEVTEIRIGNALFNRNLGKSIFFVGEPVQVCMTGRFRQGFSGPLSNLQNSVHGTVLGGIINREFCDIDTVGCNGFQSGVSCNAGAVKANDNFCYCTYITEVEASPIDVSCNLIKEKLEITQILYCRLMLMLHGRFYLELQIPANVKKPSKLRIFWRSAELP